MVNLIMKNVRINSTENEKFAQSVSDGDMFNMNEHNANSVIKDEKASKIKAQMEQKQEELEKHNSDFKESQDEVKFDIEKADIRPMFNRVLIKPFKVNPFQKMKVNENGIITELGGYNPHAQFNSVTGKYEEQDPFIITGCVVEIGPEVKYLRNGDVVYYRKDTAVPVPFFKQGFVSLGESQIIAQVGLNLEQRNV